MIKEAEEWIQQNIVYIYQISSKHDSFITFRDYCAEVTTYCPELYFQSNNFESIEKSLLMTFLNQDNISIKEIEIWDCIVHWGIAQNPELDKNISEWNDSDFMILKRQIFELIPMIRFNQISSVDFYNNIKPFKKVFEKNAFKEIKDFYLVEKKEDHLNRGPRLVVTKPKKLKLELLNIQTKCLIAGWIKKSEIDYDCNTIPYRFELILRGSRDGFGKETFDKLCSDVRRTVVVMKIKDTGELIGCYNPTYWNLEKDKQNTNTSHSDYTFKSFIFKINKYQLKKSTLSKTNKAFYVFSKRRPGSLIADSNSYANFNDLFLVDNNCYYNYNKVFAENLNLKKCDKYQELEEYEVYQLSNDKYLKNAFTH